MEIAKLLIALAEKMGLLAAAALVAVLFPPLRNRLLGVGRRRDKIAALAFGLGLSVWGALLGFRVLGEHINVRAIGVIIAAILGGIKVGALAGLGGGLFYAARVDDATAPWALAASVIDGVIAGVVASRAPRFFTGWRTMITALAIQTFHLALVGVGLVIAGNATRYIPAWPAHLVKLIVNAAGVTLFVVVARLVVSREETAVALAEARNAARTAALESLRRRLEPHFLFNALNALRATIRRNPARARELVADLADLYRYLLARPEDALLREEVDHACAYLAIEGARLGEERLRVERDIAPETADARIPALTVQPLVENAVRHGIEPRKDGGVVRLSTQRRGEELILTVSDEGFGSRLSSAVGGSGIALSTLRQRLQGRFGPAARLNLQLTEKGARATVRLPWKDVMTAAPTALLPATQERPAA